MLKFVVVPRIGEGIRLLEPDGQWASYDVLDVWHQKAEYGDVWTPYVHVRLTPPADDTGPVLRPQVDGIATLPMHELARAREAGE